MVHEGRHAYQSRALEQEGLHPDGERVDQWRRNDNDYKRFDPHNPEPYATQPLEYDASIWICVTKALYSGYQPSQDRIDLYNFNNAKSMYGYLKTSEQSQKVMSSDPAQFDMRKRKRHEST